MCVCAHVCLRVYCLSVSVYENMCETVCAYVSVRVRVCVCVWGEGESNLIAWFLSINFIHGMAFLSV